MKRHILDFEILPLYNPKTLVFLDASDYYETPERPLLEVTPPGFTKYLLVPVQAGHVNTFNSNTLGLTETLSTQDVQDLPDGVWTLKYKICPYDKLFVQKCHLRTVHLECVLHAVLGRLDVSDCASVLDDRLRLELTDIFLLIETGRAAASGCDVRRAKHAYDKAYRKATRLLKQLNGECECPA